VPLGCPQRWSRIEVGVGIDDVVGALQLHVCDKNFKWKSLRCVPDKWFKLSRYVWKMFKSEPGPRTHCRSQWRRHARIGACLFLCALHAQWQGAESLATHEIRKALLQISRFIYQQFVSKCAAAQIKVPAAICPSGRDPDFLMQFVWRTHKSPQDWAGGEGLIGPQWGQVRPQMNSITGHRKSERCQCQVRLPVIGRYHESMFT